MKESADRHARERDQEHAPAENAATGAEQPYWVVEHSGQYAYQCALKGNFDCGWTNVLEGATQFHRKTDARMFARIVGGAPAEYVGTAPAEPDWEADIRALKDAVLDAYHLLDRNQWSALDAALERRGLPPRPELRRNQ